MPDTCIIPAITCRMSRIYLTFSLLADLLCSVNFMNVLWLCRMSLKGMIQEHKCFQSGKKTYEDGYTNHFECFQDASEICKRDLKTSQSVVIVSLNDTATKRDKWKPHLDLPTHQPLLPSTPHRR